MLTTIIWKKRNRGLFGGGEMKDMNTNLVYLAIFPILWTALLVALYLLAPKFIPLMSPITLIGWGVWGWKLGECRS